MIIDSLNSVTNEMNDLNQRMGKRADLQRQEHLRGEVIKQQKRIHAITELFDYLKNEASIYPDKILVNSLVTNAKDLEKSVVESNVDEQLFTTSKTAFNTLQMELKTAWVQWYAKLTDSKRGFLNATSRFLDPNAVANTIRGMDDARNWPLDESKIRILKKALKKVDDMALGLDMGDDVMVFLEKVNNGTATLSDLTSGVQSWLKEKNLEEKLKLSF